MRDAPLEEQLVAVKEANRLTGRPKATIAFNRTGDADRGAQLDKLPPLESARAAEAIEAEGFTVILGADGFAVAV